MKLRRILILLSSCFLFSTLQAQRPDSIWKFDNDPYYQSAYESSYLDEEGNLYYTAVIYSNANVDFQFGPGITYGTPDVTRIMKYNRNFELLWIKEFQSRFTINFSLIEGNRMYLSGILRDSVDFNPDPTLEEYRCPKYSRHDYYFVEMDTSGNYRRMFILEGQNNSFFINSKMLGLYLLKDKGFLFHLTLENPLDVDPGPATKVETAYTHSSTAEYSGILLKIDSNFNYVKHQAIRNDTFGFTFRVFGDTLYYVTAQTRDWYPDKQNPGLVISRGNKNKLVFLKYDLNLNYKGKIEPYLGQGFKGVVGFIGDGKGNYYLDANFRGAISLKPGDPAYSFQAVSNIDGLIIKTSNLQTLEPDLVYPLSGGEYVSLAAIGLINGSDLLLRSYLGGGPSPDFDPGPGTFTVDKLSYYGIGFVRLDKDLNFRWAGSLKQSGDFYFSGIHIKNDSTLLIVGNIDESSNLDIDMSWKSEILRTSSGGELNFFAQYSFPKPQHVTLSDSICSGDSILYQNDYLTEAGIYSTKFLGSYYQDSTVELYLDKLPTYYYAFHEDTLCYGNTVSWRNQVLTENGFFYDSLKTIYGCDSVFSTTVFFSKVDTTLYQVDNLLVAPQFQKKYTWVDCYANYALIPSSTVNLYTPPHGGFYGVILEDRFGCIDTSRCIEVRYVGMKDPGPFPDLSVYPNPFSDVLHIDGLPPGASIRLINTLGMGILYSPCTGTSGTLQIGELPSGIYFLEIEMNGRKQRVKVVRGKF